MNKPTTDNEHSAARRLLEALDLMEFGIELMRQNIVRALPGASKELIDSELNRWLMEQPAQFIPGKPSSHE